VILQVADSLHTRGILCVVYIRFLLASTCAITRIRRWICNCYGKGELLRAEGEACAQQMCLEPLALPTISSSRTAPGRGMSDGGHGVRDERQRKYGCARRRANRDGKEKRKEKKRMRREEKRRKREPSRTMALCGLARRYRRPSSSLASSQPSPSCISFRVSAESTTQAARAVRINGASDGPLQPSGLGRELARQPRPHTARLDGQTANWLVWLPPQVEKKKKKKESQEPWQLTPLGLSSVRCVATVKMTFGGRERRTSGWV